MSASPIPPGASNGAPPIDPKEEIRRWMIVGTAGGKTFLGRPVGQPQPGQPLALSPAFELITGFGPQGDYRRILTLPYGLATAARIEVGPVTVFSCEWMGDEDRANLATLVGRTLAAAQNSTTVQGGRRIIAPGVG